MYWKDFNSGAGGKRDKNKATVLSITFSTSVDDHDDDDDDGDRDACAYCAHHALNDDDIQVDVGDVSGTVGV